VLPRPSSWIEGKGEGKGGREREMGGKGTDGKRWRERKGKGGEVKENEDAIPPPFSFSG